MSSLGCLGIHQDTFLLCRFMGRNKLPWPWAINLTRSILGRTRLMAPMKAFSERPTHVGQLCAETNISVRNGFQGSEGLCRNVLFHYFLADSSLLRMCSPMVGSLKSCVNPTGTQIINFLLFYGLICETSDKQRWCLMEREMKQRQNVQGGGAKNNQPDPIPFVFIRLKGSVNWLMDIKHYKMHRGPCSPFPREPCIDFYFWEILSVIGMGNFLLQFGQYFESCFHKVRLACFAKLKIRFRGCRFFLNRKKFIPSVSHWSWKLGTHQIGPYFSPAFPSAMIFCWCLPFKTFSWLCLKSAEMSLHDLPFCALQTTF